MDTSAKYWDIYEIDVIYFRCLDKFDICGEVCVRFEEL